MLLSYNPLIFIYRTLRVVGDRKSLGELLLSIYKYFVSSRLSLEEVRGR